MNLSVLGLSVLFTVSLALLMSVCQDAGVEIYLGAGIRFEQNSHDSNNRLSGVSLGAGKSSKVGLPGGDDIRGLSGDDGTVGVGDQAVVDVGVGHGSHRVDSTSGSSVGSPGGNNVRGVGGDDGAVGVADKRSGGVDNRSVGNTGNGVDDTSGVVEGGLGSGHGGGVGGNHGAVGVTHQLGRGESHAGREDLGGDVSVSAVMVTHKKSPLCLFSGEISSV